MIFAFRFATDATGFIVEKMASLVKESVNLEGCSKFTLGSRNHSNRFADVVAQPVGITLPFGSINSTVSVEV